MFFRMYIHFNFKCEYTKNVKTARNQEIYLKWDTRRNEIHLGGAYRSRSIAAAWKGVSL
jgi:hypothetical protein